MHTHAAPSRGKRGKPHSDTVYAAGSAKSETEKKGAILSASLQVIEDCVFSPCLTEGVHSSYSRLFAFIRGPMVFLSAHTQTNRAAQPQSWLQPPFQRSSAEPPRIGLVFLW